MKDLMMQLWQDESGQDLAEYALLLGLITVAVVTVIIAIGGNVLSLFERADDALEDAVTNLP